MLNDLLKKLVPPSEASVDVDYRVGAEIFAIARVIVVVIVALFVAWMGGPMTLPVTLILAATVVFHLGWWWYYIRSGRDVTLKVAFVAALMDIVAVGVGTMYSGGTQSPAVIVWAITLSIAGSWIGFRWTLPLIAVIVVFSVGNGLGWLDQEVTTGATSFQLGVWNAAMLVFITLHVAMGASRQRTHSRALAEAEARARRDALTGLANRAALDERLELELARAQREPMLVAVALLDLDDFKTVNDTRGHLAGDDVLVALAEQIHAHARASDLAARLGGDEFVLVLPTADAAGATELVERIRDGFARSAASRGVTFSTGIVEFDGPSNGRDVLAAADRALYRAKHAGKDRVEVERISAIVDSREDAYWASP